MQEQSELQLLPFVILIRDDSPNEIKYMLWNAGNGTAPNVKVWIAYCPKGEEEPYEYSTRTSILTKDQKDVIDDTNPSALEGNIFTIFFENINKKRIRYYWKTPKRKDRIIKLRSL